MENKLRMSEDEVLDRAVQAVKWSLEYTDDVEFSAEDAVRSEINFLVKVFNAVIKAGAKTINVPDTVGYSIPGVWGERMKTLIHEVEHASKVVWSTHCLPHLSILPNKYQSDLLKNVFISMNNILQILNNIPIMQ